MSRPATRSHIREHAELVAYGLFEALGAGDTHSDASKGVQDAVQGVEYARSMPGGDSSRKRYYRKGWEIGRHFLFNPPQAVRITHSRLQQYEKEIFG